MSLDKEVTLLPDLLKQCSKLNPCVAKWTKGLTLERASQSQLRRAITTVEAEPESTSRDSRLKKLQSHLKDEDSE